MDAAGYCKLINELRWDDKDRKKKLSAIEKKFQAEADKQSAEVKSTVDGLWEFVCRNAETSAEIAMVQAEYAMLESYLSCIAALLLEGGRMGKMERKLGKLMGEVFSGETAMEKCQEGEVVEELPDIEELVKFLRTQEEMLKLSVHTHIMKLIPEIGVAEVLERKDPDEDGIGLKVDIKAAGSFILKLLFRHAVITDIVRTMYVVDDEEYAEFVETLFNTIADQDGPPNVFLKKGCGQRGEWPYPMFYVKAPSKDNDVDLFIELQAVPRSVYKDKSKAHANVEAQRLAKINQVLDDKDLQAVLDAKTIDAGLSKFNIFEDEDSDEESDDSDDGEDSCEAA